LRADYKGKWDTPFFFFIRTLMDTYVYRNYYRKHEKWVINDVRQLQERIKTHINTFGKYG